MSKQDDDRRELDAALIVLGSIASVVEHGWRNHHRPCPFCQSLNRHTTVCYLAPNMGRQLLAEYDAIESQRDHLMAQLQNLRGSTAQIPHRSLKARFRTPAV